MVLAVQKAGQERRSLDKVSDFIFNGVDPEIPRSVALGWSASGGHQPKDQVPLILAVAVAWVAGVVRITAPGPSGPGRLAAHEWREAGSPWSGRLAPA